VNTEPDIAAETKPEAATARMQPHARAFAQRARKLETLPLGELAARVADGLTRLRADFGLEARAADPLGSLFAALPGTEIARRGADLERDLVAVRAEALERGRAAADVERRSESLKEALRERSADLAAALATTAAADAAQRELEAARARLAEVEAERDRGAGDLARSLAEYTSVAEALLVVSTERAALTADIAAVRADLGAALADAAAVRAQSAEASAERERVTGELANAGRVFDDALATTESRFLFLRAALGAADERAARARETDGLDKSALIERIDVLAGELESLRRERTELTAELARAQGDSARDVDVRQRMLAEAQRALGERDVELTVLRRDLAWRQREMNAVRAESGGLRWKLLGGDAAERIARWPGAAEGEARP